jgi:hypothetical protein
MQAEYCHVASSVYAVRVWPPANRATGGGCIWLDVLEAG